MSQPGVIETGRRYWALVLAMTILGGIAGAALALVRPDTYVATSTVVLEAPETDGVFGVGESSDRAVASQLEVFRSETVAQRAAEIAADDGSQLTSEDLADNTTFRSLPDTDVIVIEYEDTDPERARIVADSLVEAYDEVQRDQRRAKNAEVLERLDSAETVLRTDLEAVQQEIAEILSDRAIDGQIEITLDRVATVQAAVLETTSETARAAAMQELLDLQAQLQTLRLASEIERASGSLAGQLTTRSALEDELRSIAARRTELEIETATEGSGISFASPSTTGDTPADAGLAFSGFAGVALGLLMGLGGAYFFSTRRRVFTESLEPEGVLNAPLLSEVPRWVGAHRTSLPVMEDPRSLDAEAFRFVAASVDIALAKSGHKSLSFVSATVGAGKSTLVANSALAAARTGKRVLLVDADFGSQQSSKLLLGDEWLRPGLTDLVLGEVLREDAVSEVPISDKTSLHVIGRGTVTTTAPDFFSDSRFRETMSLLAARYEMVLIDGPPLLQVAYASTIARLADALVIVIKHGSKEREATELLKRVGLIGAPIVGYVYNQAPRKPGDQMTVGSMADVLGDHGLTTSQTPGR